MAEKPKRIDKDHGFMKIIIKNQVDRDKYNKEVEEEKRNQDAKRHLLTSASKKPSVPVYKPHSQDQTPKSKVTDTKNKYIFKLEFEDENGVVHHTMVSRSDTAQSVAQRMAAKSNLPEDLIEALEWRLQHEFT